MSKISTEYLARISALHPWRVLGVWLLVFVVAFGILGGAVGGGFTDALTPEFRQTNNAGSVEAQNLIDEQLTGQATVPESILVRSQTFTVDDPEFEAAVEQLRSDVLATGPEIVTDAVSFYSTGDENLVSADRRSTIIPVSMTGTVDDMGVVDIDVMTMAWGPCLWDGQIDMMGDVTGMWSCPMTGCIGTWTGSVQP